MINVLIDELTPCLLDSRTNELVETEVVQITRKSFLQNFTKKNGWYTDWSKLLEENEVYALVIKGTLKIQGMVALKSDVDAKSIFISWMVTHPRNNKKYTEEIEYYGVGGHLFAIAIERSNQFGFDGAIYGFAANEYLLNHYMVNLGASYVGLLHPYHFWINEKQSKVIEEAYTYEWTKEKW